MNRHDLKNEPWERLQSLLPPQKPPTGRPAHDHRMIINGILWILRTGAPWRDLPERYGPWQTVASCFYRWKRAGIWQLHFVDSTIIRAHQQAAGAKKGVPMRKP